jgi:hypothetical protein
VGFGLTHRALGAIHVLLAYSKDPSGRFKQESMKADASCMICSFDKALIEVKQGIAAIMYSSSPGARGQTG